MCRWIAYAGPPIYLEDLLFNQEYSIVQQSVRARESVMTTNGDGFGVVWYSKRTAPGLFKDALPAGNDANLRSLASQINTRRSFAHVRSSTGTAVNRSNYHPFAWKNWAFMHNGRVGDWDLRRRDLEALIDPAFYALRQGTTDSEALFLVALSLGLTNDPRTAMEGTLRHALRIMEKRKSREPCVSRSPLPTARIPGHCAIQAIDNRRPYMPVSRPRAPWRKATTMCMPSPPSRPTTIRRNGSRLEKRPAFTGRPARLRSSR
mgnify:CR=1 FL=1